MGAKAALKARLEAVSAVTDEVSTRIFQGVATNAARRGLEKDGNSYAVFSVVSDPGHLHIAGDSDIASPTFQLDVYCSTTAKREAFGTAARSALGGFNGTASGLAIKTHLNGRGRDSEIRSKDGKSRPIYHSSYDVTVWHPL